MPLNINTNIQSISAQNSISKAQMDQNTAMERLTTGKRINSAADDAAGLAIANKMTSQIKGLNQAVRNANDGISMLQTANGALEESSNILQRMRELAVQSASGTYDQGNRDSMNAEVTQLKAELDRIAETTEFNGIELFSDDLGDISLQVGANSSETLDFGIGSTASGDLGSSGGGDIIGAGDLLQSTGFNFASTNGMTINGEQVTEAQLQTGTDPNQPDNMQDVIDNLSVAGVKASAYVEINAYDTATTTNRGTGVISAGETVTFTLTNLDNSTKAFAITGTSNLNEVVDAINKGSEGAVKASLDDTGRLLISAEDALSLDITHSGGAADGVTSLGIATAQHGTTQAGIKFEATDPFDTDGITIGYTTAADASITGVNARTNGAVTASAVVTTGAVSAGELLINGVEIGAITAGGGAPAQSVLDVAAINAKTTETGVVASADAAGILTLTSTNGKEVSVDFADGATTATTARFGGLLEQDAFESQGKTVANIDISTAAGASDAISILDDALDQVSAIQGELGAVSNRLDFTVSNLSNVSESQSAARSRIQDADFAAESANLSRAQVLQQAGQAMLAQANSAPQQVLSLLQ